MFVTPVLTNDFDNHSYNNNNKNTKWTAKKKAIRCKILLYTFFCVCVRVCLVGTTTKATKHKKAALNSVYESNLHKFILEFSIEYLLYIFLSIQSNHLFYSFHYPSFSGFRSELLHWKMFAHITHRASREKSIQTRRAENPIKSWFGYCWRERCCITCLRSQYRGC